MWFFRMLVACIKKLNSRSHAENLQKSLGSAELSHTSTAMLRLKRVTAAGYVIGALHSASTHLREDAGRPKSFALQNLRR